MSEVCRNKPHESISFKASQPDRFRWLWKRKNGARHFFIRSKLATCFHRVCDDFKSNQINNFTCSKSERVHFCVFFIFTAPGPTKKELMAPRESNQTKSTYNQNTRRSQTCRLGDLLEIKRLQVIHPNHWILDNENAFHALAGGLRKIEWWKTKCLATSDPIESCHIVKQ